MTQKEAYCCLNCTNLPPCNAAAGNCVPCCKDCGDTSGCSSSAYFKDGKFYKDYIYRYTSALSWSYYRRPRRRRHSSSYSSIYNSATDECTLAYSIDAAFAGEGDYGSEIQSCSGVDKGLVVKDACYGCYYGGQGLGPCVEDGFWPTCTCYITSSGSCVIPSIADECQYFDKGCDNLLDCDACTQEEIDRNNCGGISIYGVVSPPVYIRRYSAKVEFRNAVKLYNNKGEEVDPSFIGATYNPCNPYATWGAQCHFFHP